MKIIRLSWVVLLLLPAVVVFALGTRSNQLVFMAAHEPSFTIASSTAVEVTADALLIFDVDTKKILLTKAQDAFLPLASVTKLLTATEFYQQANLAATTSITRSDLNTEGNAGRFTLGEVVTEHELLFALLLESSNDAAAALLRLQPDLVTRMNEAVPESTLEFFDSSGLDSRNRGTVLDMMKMYFYVLNTAPHILDITNLAAYYKEEGGWFNNNPLALLEGFAGGKQGYLPQSGRTALVTYDSQLLSGNSRRIGYVLLGSRDLVNDTKALQAWVLANVSYK